MWTLPGGGLDFGERPEDGAIREVSEETGLVAVINGPPYVVSETGIWRRSSGAVRFHQVRVIYPMTVTGGMERVEVEGSTDAIEWVSWPLVEPRPLVGFVQPILDRAIGDATGPSMRHRTRGLR